MIADVERYMTNYWALPNRATSAICDACGAEDHRDAYTRQEAVGDLTEAGWMVEECRPGAACLCPKCSTVLWSQV